MKAFIGEIPDGITAYIGSLGVVERSKIVADVYNIESFIHLQNMAFDCAYEEVLVADVRC
jgi:hypothetical protein